VKPAEFRQEPSVSTPGLSRTPAGGLVVVVGPGLNNQGGIAAVNSVYQSVGMFDNRPPAGETAGSKREHSWERPEGLRVLFFETVCEGSRLIKILYSLWRTVLFALWFPRSRLVVHLHVSTGVSFIRKYIFLTLARIKGAKILLHIHPFTFWDYAESGSRCRRRMVSRALHDANQIIVLTEGAARRARRVVPEEKIVVLPNPLNLQALQIHPATKRDEELVVFLGWYLPSKGVYDLIEALARLGGRHPALKAIFGGCKETSGVESAVRARGLDRVIEVCGWLDRDRVRTLLHACSVFALPTYTEGVPMVLLEAMACGAPIVTCPVGGIPDVAQEGRNVVYVEAGDIQGLTEALHQLLIDGHRREELSANNAGDARRFDVRGLSSRLASIYQRVCDAP